MSTSSETGLYFYTFIDFIKLLFTAIGRCWRKSRRRSDSGCTIGARKIMSCVKCEVDFRVQLYDMLQLNHDQTPHPR